MLSVHTFVFNLYQENTYILSDATGAAVIIDPGCYTTTEQSALAAYIAREKLEVKLLLNTHGHIDHMLGNSFVKERFKVPFITHQKVIGELDAVLSYGSLMGLSPVPSPPPTDL